MKVKLSKWEEKMTDWLKIERKISRAIGKQFKYEKHFAIGGGDINLAYRIEGVIKEMPASYFVKVNQKNRLSMFEAEAAGLQEIEKTNSICVPRVICSGVAANQSYLVLENLSLSLAGVSLAERLGEKLAQLHLNTVPEFGWCRDNTIGSTIQINSMTSNWLTFWREHRLGFQLDLAKQNGASNSLYIKGEKLLDNLSTLFIGYEPKASLLHGDLWSGNFGYLESGEPVIFDPAVYYGDREADIAMTELFGGFSADFYNAYNKVWPLDKGYQQRKTLYNLYHILNHYNLFGGGYAQQAERMIEQLL